ncbi:MAG: mutT-like protein [Frankiales bacterium]|nr:mutT-like protein [Frankiales bacterium]
MAARLVVLDPDGLVLLFRYDDPPPNGVHWVTPGGGLEPGEDVRAAAARELREETGWADVTVGAELGTGVRVFEHTAGLVRQHETHFAARVREPRRPLGPHVAAAHALDGISDWRWWTAAELVVTRERVFPAVLLALIVRSCRAGT